MIIGKGLVAALAVGAALLASPACAEIVQMTYTSSAGPGSSFSFTTERSPTPVNAFANSFTLNIAQFVYGGATYSEALAFNITNGGMDDWVGGAGHSFFTLQGPQLFSGTTAAPTFLLGSFNLVDYAHITSGTLTISALSTDSAVPEPATWMMLIAGFGGVGWAMRRRGRRFAAI